MFVYLFKSHHTHSPNWSKKKSTADQASQSWVSVGQPFSLHFVSLAVLVSEDNHQKFKSDFNSRGKVLQNWSHFRKLQGTQKTLKKQQNPRLLGNKRFEPTAVFLMFEEKLATVTIRAQNKNGQTNWENCVKASDAHWKLQSCKRISMYSFLRGFY